MADQQTTFRLRFDNEDMNRVLEELGKKIEETETAFRSLEEAQKGASEQATKAAKKATNELKNQAEQLDVNRGLFKEMDEKASRALDNIFDGAGQVASKLLQIGKAAGPVGVAVAAMAAVVGGAFLEVKRNADAAKRELAGLKEVGLELKDRVFSGLRAAILSTFGGPGGAIAATEEWNKALNGVRGTLGEINQRGKELYDIQKLIAAEARKLQKDQAEQIAQAQRLRILAEDEKRSTEERIKLIQGAAGSEISINQRRISQLEKELELVRGTQLVHKLDETTLDEIADIEAEIAELRGTNSVIALQNQAEINALLREEAEARDRVLQQIRDFNALTLGVQPERAIEKQITAFRELRKAAEAAGIADIYADDLARLDTIIVALEQRLAEGLLPSLEKLPEDLRTAFSEVTAGGTEVFRELSSINLDPFAKRMIDEGGKVAQSLNLGITKEVEKLSDEQRDFFIKTFGSVLQDVGTIISAGTEIAIRQQDELINARENTIRELERQIQDEERLKEQGFANNASQLRTNLERERRTLAQEQAKRLELEKKAARQRLIVDSLQQASQLTLAAATLLKEGSKGFIPGLIIAASGIALIFRIIAQAKANATQFSGPPKFRTGTEFVDGPGTGTSDSVPAFLSRGERVIPADMNEDLGGRKMTNHELMEYVTLGREFQEIHQLKGRTADDAIIPLAAAIAGGAAAQRKIEAAEHEIRVYSMEKAFAQEMQRMRDHITSELAARPIDTPMDQAIIREYKRGGTKIREVIRPKKS